VVLLIDLGSGVALAVVVLLLARRWPEIVAPHLSGETIVQEVKRHPGLAGYLRHRFDPKKATGIALIIATSVVAVAAVGIGVLVVTVRAKVGYEWVDLRLTRFAGDHASAFSTDVMRSLSKFGGTSGSLGLAAFAGVVELSRRPSRAAPAFLFLTVVIGGQFALCNGIKYFVERARPDVSRLTGFSGTSFPSGHATAASATLAAVALVVTRGHSRQTKAIVASIAAGLAVTVALTRVFLGVHWFTDVVAGLLLGWGWFALCSIAFGGRLLTFGAPVAKAETVAAIVRPADTKTRRLPHGGG
jgi:undecaprenyl-diphosphatase